MFGLTQCFIIRAHPTGESLHAGHTGLSTSKYRLYKVCGPIRRRVLLKAYMEKDAHKICVLLIVDTSSCLQ